MESVTRRASTQKLTQKNELSKTETSKWSKDNGYSINLGWTVSYQSLSNVQTEVKFSDALAHCQDLRGDLFFDEADKQA
jgi:hypothetical protein